MTSENLITQPAILQHPLFDTIGNEVASAGAALTLDLFTEKKRQHTSENLFLNKSLLDDTKIVFADARLHSLFDRHPWATYAGHLSKTALPDNAWQELQTMRQQFPFLYHHTLASTLIMLSLLLEVVDNEEEFSVAIRGSLLKDIGMMRIQKSILKNKDFLNKAEYFELCKHPFLSAMLTQHYLGDGVEVKIALYHHYYNGLGYPNWIEGHQHNRLIGLVEVADVFFALLSPRPFRLRPFQVGTAVDELIKKMYAGQLDQDAVELLLVCYQPDTHTIDQVAKAQKEFIHQSFYGLKDRAHVIHT